MKRRLHSEKGSSLVELALILPLFLLLVLGIVDFGNGFNTYIGMANATREGGFWIGRFPDERAGMIDRIHQEIDRVGLTPAAIAIIVEPDKPSYQTGDTVTLRIEHTYPLMFGAITKHASIRLRAETTIKVVN
jgi:hypothetical protein